MTERVKYPRTPHLRWSPGAGRDDLVLESCDHFLGREVVVTEKRDGENSTLYRDGLHARSVNSRRHPSRDWLKGLQGRIGRQIPKGWRVCGENLYARHSIAYGDLRSYFEVFSVWDERNRALGWDETVTLCAQLGLVHVPVLFRGRWDEGMLRGLAIDTGRQEGYVVRLAEAFAFEDFPRSVAKWVRRGHVEGEDHWMTAPLVRNRLA